MAKKKNATVRDKVPLSASEAKKINDMVLRDIADLQSRLRVLKRIVMISEASIRSENAAARRPKKGKPCQK